MRQHALRLMLPRHPWDRPTNAYWGSNTVTANYLAFHATRRPTAVAARYAGREITYSEMNRTLRLMTQSLRELGLPQGSRVAVALNDAYAHLLLLLAFERLGIATASLQEVDIARFLPELSTFDLLVTDPRPPIAGARRHLALTQDWLRSCMTRADPGDPMPMRPPDDLPARMLRTSGTTAAPKWFQISRRAQEGMIHEWTWQFALTSQSRTLLTLPFNVRAVYEFVAACLRAGGTVVFDESKQWPQLLSSVPITHTIFLPVVLARLLDELPADFARPSHLTVLCFGAHLSPALRERAMKRLATDICDLYGTIEVGSVSTSWSGGDGGFGAICPKALVEALDEGGAPVPPGKPGSIRMKTEYMADSYLDDPETTRRMFRDGWFYPGDIGILDGHGRLRILGRGDDMLNIGGVKYLPAVLEELIRAAVPVDDVGVCSLPSKDGVEELWIGVAALRLDSSELAQRVATALRGYGLEAARVRKLDRIPRNTNGKIQRNLLREMLARAAVLS